MNKRGTLAKLVVVMIMIFSWTVPTAAQDEQKRTGVVIIENGTIEDMEYWSNDLINALPQEWTAAEDNLPRYQITLTPLLTTSTCQYINTADITLRIVSADAEIIDLASGEVLNHHHIESKPLGCPNEIGASVESTPDATDFQQWAVEALQGRPGIAAARMPIILRDSGIEAVSSAAFSPDGRLVLTKSKHGITLWDAQTGELQSTITYTNLATAIFSPDGQSVLLQSSWAHQAGLFDIQTGDVRQEWDFEGLSNVVYMPDSRSILFYNPWTIVMVDAASGQKIRDITLDALFAVTATPDSQYVVITDVHGIKFWNAQTGAIEREFSSELLIHMVVVSPDGQLMATHETAPETIVVRDPQTGSALWRSTFDRTPVARFSPDSRSLVITSGGIASVRDALTGKEITHLEPNIQQTDIRIDGLTFSQDWKLVATITSDNAIYLWKAGADVELLRLGGHSGMIRTVAFSPDGRSLLTAATDGTARIWDISDLIKEP